MTLVNGAKRLYLKFAASLFANDGIQRREDETCSPISYESSGMTHWLVAGVQIDAASLAGSAQWFSQDI